MPPRPIPTGQRSKTRSGLTDAAPAARGPTEEQIRRRAHEIYIARRGAPGSPEADWHQAELELRGRLSLLGKP